MPVLSKGNTFSDGDQVTSTTLNNLVDNATFASGAVDDSTTQLSSGAIIVKDGGITPAKLSTGRPSWNSGGLVTMSSAYVSGNMGVGTNSPESSLEVEKDQNDITSITVDNNTDGSAAIARVIARADAANVAIQTHSSGYTTSNQYIADSALIEASLASGGLGLSTIVDAPFRFWQANSEVARIDTGGNLGIGETSPSAKLHVTGSAGTLPTLSASTFLVVEGTGGDASLSIIADSSSGRSNVYFGDEVDEDVGILSYDHGNDVFEIGGQFNVDPNNQRVGVGLVGSSLTEALDVGSGNIRLRSPTAPGSASDSGNSGTIAWDTNYIYVCTATDTWKRAALSTW